MKDTPEERRIKEQIAQLQRELLEVQAARWPAPPSWKVGDQVRAMRAETHLNQRAYVGRVGVVVAVTPRRQAPIVSYDSAEAVCTVDFGPDPDRLNGRDTWGFADRNLASADTPPPKRGGRRG